MKPRILKILLFTLLNLAVVEGVLRLQQAIGPLYDLEMEHVTLARMSDELNHVPLPEETWTLGSADVYGEAAGDTYTIRRDSLGVRLNALRSDPDPAAPRILFLGDSFVEGYDDANTLVQRTWEALRELAPDAPPPTMYNAGHSSYSPAILVPQARRLVPVLDPDFVVVVIDQTDLGDDYMRYERLIRRDADGRIAGVSATPIAVAFEQGLLDARDHGLYLVRMIHKLHHTRIRMPKLRREYRSWYPHGSLSNAMDPEGSAEKYAAEIAVFRRNVYELVKTLVELLGDERRVLMVVHPHRQQTVPDVEGVLWNDFVTPTVSAVASARGVEMLAAREGLIEAAGEDGDVLYWPADMHFNYAGITIYGGVIAHSLHPLIDPSR